MKKLRIHIYVEGGGTTQNIRSKLRQNFEQFLRKISPPLVNMPRIVAGGGGDDTYKKFCKALKDPNVDLAILLLDSEEAVSCQCPWEHLQNRKENKCSQPERATDDQCHLMVQCMESWFLADIEQLKNYYGNHFKADKLSSARIENISKQKALDDLKKATKDTQKKKYSKGDHSFEILGKIDPEKIKAASKWAKRFFETLNEKCQ